MQNRMLVVMAVGLLCVSAWGVPDANAPGQVRASTASRVGIISSEGVDATPTPAARGSGDVPDGYQPPPAPEPTQGEPPQIIEMRAGADGGDAAGATPLWGPDVTVYPGSLRSPSPVGSERMIAYDQSEDGTLYSAFVVPNGDTAWIYRSTDQGGTWAKWNGIYGPSSVWSSLELVVAEGDSDFVFFFAKRSTGNGDIYVGRWDFGTTTANLFSVKVDADTVANFSACRDLENHYYLYVTFETRNGNYNMYQLRSTDYGKTWSGMPGTEEIVDTQTPPKPDICCGSGGNIYTVIRDLRQSSVDSVSFRLKYSPSRGDTWYVSTQIGTPTVPIYDPVVGARHNNGTVWLVHTRDLELYNDKGLGVFYYYSTDSGATWSYGGDDGIGHADTDNNEQMPSIACDLGTGYPTVCYAVVPSESLMFTWCDADSNWTTPEKVNDYRHTGNFPPQAGWKDNYSSVLYAGSGPAGLYFDAFYMTGMEEGRPVAEVPAIVVTRPSPARDRAAMEYNLPRAGSARVSILDIAGREVAVLVHGTLAAGAHSSVWDCAKVPAGVYLVRLETSTGSQTGRVVVSR